MKRKNRTFLKIIFITSFLIILNGLSFILSYLRYDNSIDVEVEFLRLENNRLQERISELNDQLKLDIGKYDYKMAKVLIRDIHNFYKEMIINKGSDDGVSKGMAIVNEEGLVGIVDQVDKKKSRVKLLTSEYNVSVSVGEIYGNLQNGRIDMLDKYAEIQEGDAVYTSGLAYIPKGIYVGKVLSVKYDKNNLGKEVKIDLIDNRDLNYVAIIVGEI